jgi:hypothetical protein
MNKYDYLCGALNKFNKAFKRSLAKTEHTISGLSKWHLEGDVYTHTMLVVKHFTHHYYETVSDDDSKILLWSCLLHDVGKPYAVCRRKNKGGKTIQHMSGHELISAQIAIDFLKTIDLEEQQKDEIVELVLKHTSAHDITVDNANLSILNECDEAGRIFIN